MTFGRVIGNAAKCMGFKPTSSLDTRDPRRRRRSLKRALGHSHAAAQSRRRCRCGRNVPAVRADESVCVVVDSLDAAYSTGRRGIAKVATARDELVSGGPFRRCASGLNLPIDFWNLSQQAIPRMRIESLRSRWLFEGHHAQPIVASATDAPGPSMISRGVRG